MTEKIEGTTSSQESEKKWESQKWEKKIIFRDGEGNLCGIYNEATHYDPAKQGFSEWIV